MEESIQVQVLNILQNARSGLQMEDLADRLNLTRHTVAKYLEVLRAEGKIRYDKVGRTKLWSDVSAAFSIRFLGMNDIDSILRIEAMISNNRNSGNAERPENLKDAIAYHLQYGDPLMRLGAEIDGKLVGFIIAEIRHWEFGRGETTGWILILGVDPECRGMGVGHKLGATLIDHFHRKNVAKIRTLVEWHDGELISYFKSLGFTMLQMVPLEKSI